MYEDPTRAATIASEHVNRELWNQVCDQTLGESSSEDEREVLRCMIEDGSIVMVFDGLDELMRTGGQDAAAAVARQIEAFIAASEKARVIISCRHHIFDHLKGLGILVHSLKGQMLDRLELGLLDLAQVRDRLWKLLRRDPGKLAEIARLPLIYEMIRQTRDDWSESPAPPNSTLLEKAWFQIMLRRSGQPRETLAKLGAIGGMMLANRTDLLKAGELDDPDLAGIMRALSKKEFPLFVEEEQDTYAFSHQVLREFVLAWRVAEEIQSGHFDLLKSSRSFDYEGAEFYSRINDLVSVENEMIPRLKALQHSVEFGNAEWNHLVRNLFEMIGEVMPPSPAIAEAAVRVGLSFLRGDYAPKRYLSYNTKYNIVRSMERCHYLAPRPYFRHILEYDWSEELPNEDHFGAYAVRGFRRRHQRPGPLPPIAFEHRARPRNFDELERTVADTLIEAITGLEKLDELFEDAHFCAINCTYALIRWLPQSPKLDRIVRLLKLPYASEAMKQNLFWSLYRRFDAAIPPEFAGNRLFRGSGVLAQTAERQWASARALKAYSQLLSDPPPAAVAPGGKPEQRRPVPKGRPG
jgi:hypothetical protein